MERQDGITVMPENKRGQGLRREERGAARHLKRHGYTNAAEVRITGCSPPNAASELERGTPPRENNKGRAPVYSEKHGETAYHSNRRRPHTGTVTAPGIKSLRIR